MNLRKDHYWPKNKKTRSGLVRPDRVGLGLAKASHSSWTADWMNASVPTGDKYSDSEGNFAICEPARATSRETPRGPSAPGLCEPEDWGNRDTSALCARCLTYASVLSAGISTDNRCLTSVGLETPNQADCVEVCPGLKKRCSAVA